MKTGESRAWNRAIRFTTLRRLAPLGLPLLLCGCPNGGGGTPAACETGAATGVSTVSYAANVRPILTSAGCLSSGCHGGASQSGFDLSSYESSFVAGEQATALEFCPIVPGDPDASYLVQKLRANPPSGARMPLFGTPLSEESIETIATWIREGAADN